ncbi:hypothetical protein [Streptomyces sp. NPDC002088]|uniref:hypothetical protein n=1 Tax=Streptomyces sp. NPDC002088 TaxID=3154665 RepID=UPI00332F628F
MNARRKLIAALSEDSYGGIATLADVDHAEHLVNAHAAEVIAERDAEIMRWLGKKAREYRATGSKQHALQADAVELMASKISRGAVRPDNTLLPAGVAPLFFEPGRTYTENAPFRAPEDRPNFQCVAVAIHPTTGNRRALGFEQPGAGRPWSSASLRDEEWADGWVEITGEVTG